MIKFKYKLFFQKRKQRISFFAISPSFDWKVILSIGMLLFLAGAIHIAFLYIQITNGSLFEVEEDTTREMTAQTQSTYIEETIEKIDAYRLQDSVLDSDSVNQNFDEAVIN